MPNSVNRIASSSLSVDLIAGVSSGMGTKDMFSEIMFCRKTNLRNRLKPLKGNEPFNGWPRLAPIFISVLILIGCGDDENPIRPMRHIIEINELNITSQMLNTGSTATVAALFDYSGDKADLIYTWEANGGRIVGGMASVTYLAPDAPGVYTITLELTDGFEVDQGSITVEVVVLQSLRIDSNTYWSGEDETPVLKYQVNVTQLLRPAVTLRYEILQDGAKTGAFLSIGVNGNLFVEEEAIGEVRPVEKPVITGGVDVSRIITGPGAYDLTLTLAVVNAVERGWLLQKAELIGVEGSAVRR